MKIPFLLFVSLVGFFSLKPLQANSQEIGVAFSHSVDLIENDSEKKIDVLVDGTFFTSYCYSDTYYKPVLYPVNTPNKVTVTRGFPAEPRPGERTDHPHHVGIWFAHGNVNGLDFWNQSDDIPQNKKSAYGTIRHKKISSKTQSVSSAKLTTESDWIDYKGKVLLNEETTFHFICEPNYWAIVRTTKLTATNKPVRFGDTKEGLFGFRVCREYEDCDDIPKVLLNNQLIPTDTILTDNRIASGVFLNNDGLTKKDVWGKPAKWLLLRGTKNSNTATIGICDHRDNPGYPAMSHARGYGLFALNNMGSSSYGNYPELEYTLKPKQSMVFKHLFFIVVDHDLRNEDMEAIIESFHSNN